MSRKICIHTIQQVGISFFKFQYQFFGWQLGFWFSQQGAIYVFVILIFVYVALMNRLDRRFGLLKEDD